MINGRIPISKIVGFEEEENELCVSGRLVQISPATITIDDQSDRRTFGFRNQNPDLSRVRLGDILELSLIYKNKAWRVQLTKVLVPCTASDELKKKWMQKWTTQCDTVRKNLCMRAELMASLRMFFQRNGFLEVSTPTLVKCGGMEPNLVAFETDWQGPGNSFKKRFHLPTSPEFSLKKMLVLGYEKIFEFAKAFRNGELSEHHQPEFTMLEWYRSYEGYDRLMKDTEIMVSQAAKTILGKPSLNYRGYGINLTPPWTRISVRDLFVKQLNIDIDKCRNAAQLAEAAKSRGYKYVKSNESFDDTFFRLFITEIEGKLGWDKPVILYDYPIEMAALARKKPENPRYCERFEIYIAGLELANAFGELNNPNEQARRFKQFSDESRANRGLAYQPDPEFMEALQFGMPPSSGIALGFERLLMLFANATSINDVLPFPHTKN